MGGAFDVKHKLHGLAFILGIPFLPIAALIISYDHINPDNCVACKSSILFSTHSTWISAILMAIFMVVIMSGFKKADMPMGPNVEPPNAVPKGVIALNGYANRILIRVC